MDTDLYAPLNEHLEELKSVEKTALKSDQEKTRFERELDTTRRNEDEVLLIPFNGRFQSTYILMDKKTGEILRETGIETPPF